jgi:hypothetical protein
VAFRRPVVVDHAVSEVVRRIEHAIRDPAATATALE